MELHPHAQRPFTVVVILDEVRCTKVEGSIQLKAPFRVV
jgi:hypothetical protein